MKQMHKIMSIVVMLSLLLGATAGGLPTAASQPGERGPDAGGRIDVGLPAVPNWTVEGMQQDAAFGCSISAAGDVNGDGYDDALIGARNEGPAAIGRAYAYYGSATGFGSTPDWMVEGDQAAAEFGILVRAAGDLNGDGYDDVIAGASSYDGGQTDGGRVYVYYGSASGLSPTPDWTAEGNQANARFGFRGGAAGDVNGDGYDDLIVGAYLYSNGQSGEGRVYVYYGSGAGLGLTPPWTAESNQADAWFGVAAGAAGDVNGDGYDDVIVGAHQYDDGEVDEGRVFVYYGSAAGLGSAPDWMAESDQAYSNYGLAAGAAGDLNGDGYDDVIVGAFTYDGGETDEGRAYVYYGSASGLSPAPGWIAESDQAGSSFGYAVSAAGDVNADGYDDVIVGAFFYDGGETDEGRAYVYYGSSTGLGPVPHWTMEAGQAGARFGYAVSAAGRPIGGPAAGVLVGVYGWDGALMNNVGRVDLYLGARALGFAKSAEDLDGWPLYEGDTIEYTIVVTNPNPLAAAGVLVEDGIPAHTTYVEGSAVPPPTSGPSPLRWSDQTIPPGAAAVYRFRVTVDAGAGGQVIGNVAGLAEPGDTPRRIGPIVVPGPGDGRVFDRLEILKTARDLNGPPLFEGDAIEYTILVTNPNPLDMPGVTISDAIPDYTSYVEGSAAPPPTSGPDPLVWGDQTVPAGATAAYRFQVTVDPGAAGQSIVNSAGLIAPGDHPAAGHPLAADHQVCPGPGRPAAVRRRRGRVHHPGHQSKCGGRRRRGDHRRHPSLHYVRCWECNAGADLRAEPARVGRAGDPGGRDGHLSLPGCSGRRRGWPDDRQHRRGGRRGRDDHRLPADHRPTDHRAAGRGQGRPGPGRPAAVRGGHGRVHHPGHQRQPGAHPRGDDQRRHPGPHLLRLGQRRPGG